MINRNIQVEGEHQKIEEFLNKNYTTEVDSSTLDQAKAYFGRITVIGSTLMTLWTEKVKIELGNENEGSTDIRLKIPLVKYIIVTIIMALALILIFQFRNMSDLDSLIFISIFFIVASIITQAISVIYRVYAFTKQFKREVKNYIGENQ